MERKFKMNLDRNDWKLLKILQEDCRISNADLAEKTGMSASSCWRKVRAFEEAGLIERYSAIVNPEAVGLTFQAIVHVHLTRHDPDKLENFVQTISKRPEVVECFATTGQADYHLRIVVKDLAAYNDFLDQVLFRLPAVSSAQTNVVLRNVVSGKGLATE